MISINLFVPVVLLCGGLTTATFVSNSPESTDQCVENENEAVAEDASWYRLPEYVVPESYELWILPQLAVGNFTYEGRVKIDLDVREETKSLIVHVNGLNVFQEQTEVLAIFDNHSVEVPISDQQVDTKRQFYIVSLTSVLTPGRYRLSLSFSGDVIDYALGFYRSAEKVNGKIRWLGFTQFSSTFARWAFPCLDEPWLKATYRIHLGHYGNETVTGNTVAEDVREIKPGYFLTTLALTPKMPTYLVGWAIHDFKYTNAPNSTTFGLWTRENMKPHASRFLAEGIKIYDALRKWIDVENPVVKMEQIAVPDFYFSAMENWGMVTFRESGAVWKEGFTSTAKIHSALSTMSHEYAHTWFGNLVTPKFWNVAWLKEGFATFFGHYGQSLVKNDSRIMDLFPVEVLQEALLEDSTQHNRTMNGQGVGSPESIRESMDFVAYKKGGSVIRMIKHVIGDWAFHRGLQSYVNAMKNSYATPQDLYKHLQNYSDQSNVLEKSIRISQVMETWTSQPGYPVLTVKRNYTSNVTEIAQDRFYLNRNNDDLEADNSRWWIPVNFAAAESHGVQRSSTAWIRSQDKSILIPTIKSTETLLCNIDQAYYYRVNYDETNWQRLTNHLNSINFTSIGEPNRASLIDDSFNLARAGYINYSTPLNLSRYLTRERAYSPWLAASRSFDFLSIMLGGVPGVHRAFQTYLNRLTESVYEHVTFDNISSKGDQAKLLQNLISTTACFVNNANCMSAANLAFKGWLAGSNETINPDQKEATYCTGIRLGSAEDWRRVLQIFLETELHTEQELLIAGLGCTNNSALIKEFLNYILYDGPELRKQYKLVILNAVLAGNPENVDYAMDFIAENLKKISEINEVDILDKVFRSLKKRVVREDQLQKFKALVNNNIQLLGQSAEKARKAVKFAQDNIVWIRNYVPNIAKWLREANFLPAQ